MNPQTPGQPVDILLAEDNPGDVQLIREAMKDGKLSNPLHVVTNGVEAMAFLRRESQYAGVPTPGLILLDLNLPRKDGREVLAEVKADPLLRRIPVVVLTSSEAERDILESYELHANCYVIKPLDLERFLHVVQSIDHFWLTVAKLPPDGKLRAGA